MSAKNCSLAAIPFLLAACASGPDAPLPGESDEAQASAEEQVESSSYALAGSNIPVMVSVGDQLKQGETTVDNVEDRAYTRQGFVWHALLKDDAQLVGAQGYISNFNARGTSLTYGSIYVTLGCVSRTDSTKFSNQALNYSGGTVPGQGSSGFARPTCPAGFRPMTATFTYRGISSSAPDIGFTDSGLPAALMSIAIGGAADQPNVEAWGRNKLQGVSKWRSTWGAIEVTNHSTSPQTLFLRQQTTCSGSTTPLEKFIASTTANPGQTVTSTVSCPSGQTVVGSFGNYGQPL